VPGPSRLTFLIDTNIFVTLEPFGAVGATEPFEEAATFQRRVHEHGHLVALHSETKADIDRDTNDARRKQSLKAVNKYLVLDNVPASAALLEAFGASENDQVDALIASALEANAAHYLVTEDRDLRQRVARVAPAFGPRALSLAEAIELLDQLHPPAPEPPPLVELRPCYSISLDDPIFESIRGDYAEFDEWFERSCQLGQREAFVIGGGESLAGICILKDEDDEEYGLPSRRLKLCTVKVAEPHRRQRYGALLIKAALDNAVRRERTGLYVTVFDHHEALIRLLEDLGFTITPQVTKLGELIMWRPLLPPPEAASELDGFEFNRRYGPYNLKLDAPMHIIPIQPQWEERLFPEGRLQLEIIGENAACGNDLRKAYLSHASSQRLSRGDLILFYRSSDERAVRFVAVVESTLRSADASEIVSFVGTRTVYTADEIEEMTDGGRRDVLAVLLRQARHLNPGWSVNDLIANGVIGRAPQSIQSIPDKGAEWIRTALSV
jgi:RimJ/RimL family protein N-acetyltransferase